MAHARSDSLASVSTLTSISSRSSVEKYESLKEEIISIEQSEIDLLELVGEAEKIVNEKLTPTREKVFKYEKDSEEVSIDLDDVMKAMLFCAEELEGKRYAASAIVACTKHQDEVETLVALATTWLTHFLFVFRSSRAHENQRNKEPSALATPTLDETASQLGEGVGSRGSSFRDDVMVRDGFKCVVTGYKDFFHPEPDENDIQVFLRAAHILRRSIGKFDNDHTSASFKSAVTTFDILKKFTRIPVSKLEDLHSHIDDPSNGMMLQNDAHDSFDRFYWCLKKTETENVYTLKVFKGRLMRVPENNLVTFRDHSDDFNSEPSGSRRKRKRPIALPDPNYISIHATLAGVLNMSGAGRFFDELLDKYKDDEGNVPPVRSWPELEKVIEEEMLREFVAESLRSVKVY